MISSEQSYVFLDKDTVFFYHFHCIARNVFAKIRGSKVVRELARKIHQNLFVISPTMMTILLVSVSTTVR